MTPGGEAVPSPGRGCRSGYLSASSGLALRLQPAFCRRFTPGHVYPRGLKPASAALRETPHPAMAAAPPAPSPAAAPSPASAPSARRSPASAAARGAPVGAGAGRGRRGRGRPGRPEASDRLEPAPGVGGAAEEGKGGTGSAAPAAWSRGLARPWRKAVSAAPSPPPSPPLYFYFSTSGP